MKKKKLGLLEALANLKKDTTGQPLIAVVVYFLLFTVLLSSGLFTSRLNIHLGDPSPQLITAPWTKDIEDYEKYKSDQDAAAQAVKPVYTPDEDYLSGVAKDLSKAFVALNEAVNSSDDASTIIARLRQTLPFGGLTDGVLKNLIGASPQLLDEKEKIATQIIIGDARGSDTGAHNSNEVTTLRDSMKQDIDKAALTGDFKIFLQAFVDTRITQPTLIVDEHATEQLRQSARASVKLEVHSYKAGQKIVGPGEIVDESVMRVLTAYGLVKTLSPWRTVTGIALVVLISMFTMILYARQYRRHTPQLLPKMLLMGLSITLVLVIGKGILALNLGGSQFNALAGILIPTAWATMTIAILIDPETALLSSMIIAVFVGILADPIVATSYGLQIAIISLFSGVVGVFSVSRLSQRSDLARASLSISVINVISVSAIALTSGMGFTAWLVGVLLGIVNGLSSSVLTVGTLHWFEAAFHITSAIRLLELSNPNRPLLKRLLVEAPGTYHHSVLVGNLAEAAAEEVEADAVLVRVGAMYHDIGKLKRPYFFIENQFAQDNPHDKIAPTLSALIITSHIKDGLEMAKEEKLPQAIQDIIAQHHGDSIVSFFYHKAVEDNPETPEETFHYEGPRPQTKETALVMLADSVEAAVRSMKQATPGRIEGLVRKIIKDKLNNDQLNQSDLTFRDLDKIADAFLRVLTGIFHSRVEYPEFPTKIKNAVPVIADAAEDAEKVEETSPKADEVKAGKEAKEAKEAEKEKEAKEPQA
ncbi:MAG: HDIG domain-containing protein [Desulfitobacterium sp.]|nr:HDIG domain-containing metalloprotein [Desulfitobacterium sp.]MEA4902535.1 HDIG domain-containing protein [Desulfitobacterium sp.]